MNISVFLRFLRGQDIRGTRYAALLFTSIALVFLTPVLHETTAQRLILDFLRSILLVLAVVSISDKRGHILVGSLLCVPIIFLTWAFGDRMNVPSEVVDSMLRGSLYLYVTLIVLSDILFRREVRFDHIFGAAAIFFLLGFMWSEFYELLVIISPGSIVPIGDGLDREADLLYFSFSNLVTLGFGDILPKSGLARSCVVIQAATGQLSIAVLIGRLIGLHVNTDSQDRS